MNLAIHLLGLASSMSIAFLPRASNASQDMKSLLPMYERATRYVILIMSGLVSIAFMFGESLLRIWMGSEFSKLGTGVLHLGLLAFGIHGFSVIAFQVADGLIGSKWNLLATVAAGVIFVSIALPATDLRVAGIEGPAFARIGAVAAWIVFMFLIDRRIRGSFGGRFYLSLLARIGPAVATACLVSTICLTFLAPTILNFTIGVLMSSIAFLALSLLTGALKMSEINGILFAAQPK